jgi:hypothetical protein
MTQVLEVGKQLSQVSAQIYEVNEKLTDLDSLIMSVNEARNLVSQVLQEGRALAEELARQRYVTRNLIQRFGVNTGDGNAVLVGEEEFRAEFDQSLIGETLKEEPNGQE